MVKKIACRLWGNMKKKIFAAVLIAAVLLLIGCDSSWTTKVKCTIVNHSSYNVKFHLDNIKHPDFIIKKGESREIWVSGTSISYWCQTDPEYFVPNVWGGGFEPAAKVIETSSDDGIVLEIVNTL